MKCDIAVLVNNSARHDARVIRQVHALSVAGHSVAVICLSDESAQARLSGLPSGVDWIYVEASSVRYPALPFLRLFEFPIGFLSVYFFVSVLLFLCSPVIILSRLWFLVAKRVRSGVEPRFSSLVDSLAYSALRSQRYMRASRNVLLRLRPKLIIANDLDTLETAVVCASSSGAKVLYDAHELETERVELPGRISRWVTYQLELQGIRRVHAVTTVSLDIAERLSVLYGIEVPTVVLNSPVVTRFDSFEDVRSPVPLRESLSLASDVPLIVYVGLVAKERNLEPLVEVLSLLQSFHLALVGPDVASSSVHLLQLANDLGVADRLHIVPPVRTDEVVDFIRGADIGVIPVLSSCVSHELALPNKLFEMAIAGIPMVVPDLRLISDFVESKHLGVVAQNSSVSELARAVSQAYAGRDQYVLKGDALTSFLADFGWEAQASKLRVLVSGLLRP